MKQWMKPEVVNLTINKTDEDDIEPALISYIYYNYCDFKTNDCSGIMSHLHSNAGKDNHPEHPNDGDYWVDSNVASTVCGALS